MVKENFKVFYLNSAGESTKCANVNIYVPSSGIDSVDFTYHDEHIASAWGYGVDPSQLPLSTEPFILKCSNALPAFIDDIIPDAWGKKVISRVHGIPYPTNVDLLKHLGNSTLGALKLTQDPNNTSYEDGCDIEVLADLELVASKIDEGVLTQEEFELLKFTVFAQGSSVGGARPKVLVHDEDNAFIAKFSKSDDKFVYATVEHACLRLIASVDQDIRVATSRSVPHPVKVNDSIFLTTRFDVPVRGKRKHLITVNGMLKNTETQEDKPAGSYEDILGLISNYSYSPAEDKKQLFVQMLFNKCLNNTDDHLRNFSFILEDDGWRLSPVYDIVPSLVHGSYHQLAFNYSEILPSLEDAIRYRKKFSLSEREAKNIIVKIKAVMVDWKAHFTRCGVSAKDIETLSPVIQVN